MKNKSIPIAGAIIIIAMIIMIAKNYHSGDFFNARLVEIFDVGSVSFLIFLLTERMISSRRKRDAIERIVLEIRANVCDKDFFSMVPESVTLQVSCDNKIKYLTECGVKDIQEDVKYIKNQLEEIRMLHSNHPNDLNTVSSDFVAHRIKILDKCDKIQVMLYK